MTKFIRNTSIFFIITLLVINIFQIIQPYSWGNPRYPLKIKYLENSQKGYNTFFFGSSRILRHIDPFIFDELTSTHISSYNLGSGATFNPEAYFLLEKFIHRSEKIDQGYIIIELQTIYYLENNNAQNKRVKYYLNPREYWFLVNTILENNKKSNLENIQAISEYTILFLEKTFGIGVMNDIVKIIFDDTDFDMYGDKSLGFIALEADSPDRISRNQKFLETPGSLVNRKEEIQNVYQKNKNSIYSNTHLKRIEYLISLAKDKGYHLIFLLPPKLTHKSYSSLLPLFSEINDKNRIDLANPDLFPELYLVEYSFDIGHFNKEGTRLYTSLLASKFNELFR